MIMTLLKSKFSISSMSRAALTGFPLLKTSPPKKKKKRAWQKLMTASEKTTERVQKHVWAAEEVRGKTLNSCFLPSSLCSSFGGVPCDLPDPSLWLTEGTAALFISPLTWFYAPRRPPHRHSAARRKRWWGGGVGGGGLTSRRDSPSGFSSVPGHCTLLAGILFTHTHKHTDTHTHTNPCRGRRLLMDTIMSCCCWVVFVFLGGGSVQSHVCYNMNRFSNSSL